MSKKMGRGYEVQDRIIAKFNRDKNSSNNNSAVVQCIKNTKAKKFQPKEVVQFSWAELVKNN
jgi:hypothetical protein|tara:strand:+ start:713 stop:898 length:186 start_codon:yes stop_codon:yes gene_type:complete